jgi:hypothetical protein
MMKYLRRLSPWCALVTLGIAGMGVSASAQPYTDPDEPNFEIRNLEPINTDADDYAPYMTPNGGWFYLTSSRNGSANLYRSPRQGERWGTPENPAHVEVNSSLDEGSFSAPFPPIAQLFELTEQELERLAPPRTGVFTTSKRSDGVGDADIYLLGITPGGLQLDAITPLPAINTEDWDAQGSISPDGSFIVLSSNRPDGMGDMDLYISMRQPDGSYAAPMNLGATINTSENEFSPFVAPDGRTLFFASTGHEGFGESDLFMTKLGPDGRWSEPKNLGEKINTPANELFFFGAGRSRCYFVSDRPGGKGGLDIYEATPNLFAQNYSLFKVSFPDTTTGRNLRGRIKVIESSLGRVVADMDVDSLNGAALPLLAGFEYRVEARVPGFETFTTRISNFPGDTTLEYRIKFGSAPPPPPPPPTPVFSYTIDGIVVPFFVSGYYRVNTIASLNELKKRQGARGDLKSQTYIADVANDKAAYEENRKSALKVEELLGEFSQIGMADYFPNFLKYVNSKLPGSPKEYLLVTVYGFADPRPIIGSYSEQPKTFLDSSGNEVTVSRGEVLDNFKLAGLRARYTVEYFDSYFRKAGGERSAYVELAERGLIRWRAVSGNVDDLLEVEDLGTKRRIKVDFKVVQDGKKE